MGNTTSSRKSTASDSKAARKHACRRQPHQHRRPSPLCMQQLQHEVLPTADPGTKKGSKFLQSIPGIRRNKSHLGLSVDLTSAHVHNNRSMDQMTANIGEHIQKFSNGFVHCGGCADCVAHALLDTNYVPCQVKGPHTHSNSYSSANDFSNGMMRSHSEGGSFGHENCYPKLIKSDNNDHSTTGSNSSTSIVPAKYIWQDGRRMLNEDMANYLWPTDLDETDRLNTQHNIIRYVLRRTYLAPVNDPKRILDVGCGTGMWMKEVARDYPKASLIGVDIADIFMQTDMPNNCAFELGNILEGLSFSSNRYDFVHQRLMSGAIPASFWPTHVGELFRITQSGGFLELADTDFSFQNVGDIGYRVNKIVEQCFAYRGLDLSIIRRLDKLMKRAGYIEIQARIVEFPVGEWAGISGRMMRNNIDEALRSLKKLAAIIGVVSSEEEYDKLLDELWQDCDEHRTLVHAYYFYGQKP